MQLKNIHLTQLEKIHVTQPTTPRIQHTTQEYPLNATHRFTQHNTLFEKIHTTQHTNPRKNTHHNITITQHTAQKTRNTTNNSHVLSTVREDIMCKEITDASDRKLTPAHAVEGKDR